MAASHAIAQSLPVVASDEYRSKLRVTDVIQPAGDAAFGEKISLYDGSISWSQVDVTLKGTGPVMEIRRQFEVPDLPTDRYYRSGMGNLVGDWKLELPRIDTLSAQVSLRLPSGGTGTGWFFIDDAQRCSALPAAPAAPGSNGASYAAPDWWHGYALRVGGENQDILRRGAENAVAPQANGPIGALVFPGSTTKNWAVGCTPRTANGAPGEGFIAVAPDGTRYWLDWLVQRPADSMTRGDGGTLARRRASMLVSRVVDRLGNTVTYQYDSSGNPLAIMASDGRQLRLTYDTVPTPDGAVARLRTVTATGLSAGQRTWTYNYDNGQVSHLTGVILPDGSSWSFGMNTVTATQVPGQTLYQGCGDPVTSVNAAPWTATMRNPDGMTAQFTGRVIVRGLSGVPKVCASGTSVTPAIASPNAYLQTVVTDKTYSGAGVDPSHWAYLYSPPAPSWSTTCQGGACPATVWTDVIDPQNRGTRYTFSNRFDATNSQLTRRDIYDAMIGSSALLRSEVYTYAPANAGPWPSRYGASQQDNINLAQIEGLSPLAQRVLTQDGDTYTRRIQEFDPFGQPVRVVQSNSTTPLQLDVRRERQFNPSLWVLDRVARVTNVANGEVMERYDYDASMNRIAVWRFGRQVSGFAYDMAGNVTSEVDGKGAATQYTGYVAGVPGIVKYADGTQVTRDIDGFGQVTRQTDQAMTTTTYAYDPMGRLIRTVYPTGDTTTWAPTDTRFEYITFAEAGLAAGHWRRTESTGAKVTTTWYDAWKRPVLVFAGGNGTQGETRAFGYDGRGRRTFEAYPVDGQAVWSTSSRGVHTDYDGLGRELATRRDAENGTLVTTTMWPGHASRVVRSPTGATTTTAYLSFGEPSYDWPIHILAPEGVQRDIDRDVYGYPLATRQQGGVSLAQTNLFYDSAHRLCRRWTTERGSEMFGYDGADNIVWTASVPSYTGNDCGENAATSSLRTVRAYDPLNHLKSVVYPGGGEAIGYSYDQRGQLAGTSFAAGTWTYGRNRRGLLTAEVLATDGFSWSFTYDYDANGVLSATHYPDGSVVAYNPNALGRPTTAGAFASAADWFPDGGLRSFRFGNGTTFVAEKNPRRLPAYFAYGSNDGTMPVAVDLTYDAGGNLMRARDLSSVHGPDQSFTYDGRDRLLTATASDTQDIETYTWDGNDNLRSVRTFNTSTDYLYDNRNLPASVVTNGQLVHSYQYDPQGMLALRDDEPMGLDAASRVEWFGSKGKFTYDAANRRIKSVVGGVTTYFAYTADGRLMWTYDTGIAKGTGYVYLGSRLVALSGDNGSRVLGDSSAPVQNGDYWYYSGFVCSSGVAAPIAVRLYTNDSDHLLVGSYMADQPSNDGVRATCKTSTPHGFRIELTDALRQAYQGRGLIAYGVDYYDGSEGHIFHSEIQMPAPGTRPAKVDSIAIAYDAQRDVVSASWPAQTGATYYRAWQVFNGARMTIGSSSDPLSAQVYRPLTGHYAFEVQACNPAGCSDASASPGIDVIKPSAQPAAPYPVGVSSSAPGALIVSWPASITAGVSYQIQVMVPGDTWRAVVPGSSTTDTQMAYQASASGSYYFRVRACAPGCSSYATSDPFVVTAPTGAKH